MNHGVFILDRNLERLIQVNPYKEVPRLSHSRLDEISDISRITDVRDFNPDGDSAGKSLKWPMISKAVLIRDSYACRICGKSDFTSFSTADQYSRVHLAVQVHHIVPRKNGGKDTFSNLITLCEECHRKTFSNDHAGLPVTSQTTIYGFEKRISLCVRDEWLRTRIPVSDGSLKDYGRAFDTSVNRYRIVPRKGEHIPVRVADLSMQQYRDICEVAHTESSAVDYATMYAETARGKERIRLFISSEGEFIL